jgi:hypothetical protein
MRAMAAAVSRMGRAVMHANDQRGRGDDVCGGEERVKARSLHERGQRSRDQRVLELARRHPTPPETLLDADPGRASCAATRAPVRDLREAPQLRRAETAHHTRSVVYSRVNRRRTASSHRTATPLPGAFVVRRRFGRLHGMRRQSTATGNANAQRHGSRGSADFVDGARGRRNFLRVS